MSAAYSASERHDSFEASAIDNTDEVAMITQTATLGRLAVLQVFDTWSNRSLNFLRKQHLVELPLVTLGHSLPRNQNGNAKSRLPAKQRTHPPS
eukprot:1165051-Amphidinium_carterae.1